MRRKGIHGVYIVPRDLMLFDYLFSNKVATALQISRDVFGSKDICDVRRRLRLLARQNYLVITGTGVQKSSPKFLYSISEKAFNAYIQKRLERQWSQLKSDSPDHDAMLVDIRYRFMKSRKVLRYLTENAIEAQFDCPASFPVSQFIETHCDAAIIYCHNGRTFNVAIEYEDSIKHTPRYEAHFSDYYTRNEIHAIIYIVAKPGLGTHLADLDKRFCQNRKAKLFFGTLENVLSTEPVLQFQNNTGEIIQID